MSYSTTSQRTPSHAQQRLPRPQSLPPPARGSFAALGMRSFNSLGALAEERAMPPPPPHGPSTQQAHAPSLAALMGTSTAAPSTPPSFRRSLLGSPLSGRSTPGPQTPSTPTRPQAHTQAPAPPAAPAESSAAASPRDRRRESGLRGLVAPLQRALEGHPPWPYTYIDDDYVWCSYVNPMFTSQDVKAALHADEAYERPQYPVAVLRSYISYKLGRVKSAALVVDKLKYIELDLVTDGGLVHLCGAFAAIRDEYILGYSSVAAIRRLQRTPATLRAMARSGSLPFGEDESEAAPAFDDGAGLAFAPPSYVQATDAASDERKYCRAKRAARSYERRLVESEAARRTAEVAWRAAEEARAEAEDEKERLADQVRRLEAVVAGRRAWPLAGHNENDGRKMDIGQMGLYNAWTDADAGGASDDDDGLDVFGRVEVPAPLVAVAPPKPPRSVRRKPAPSLILPSLPALDNLSLLARDE
ncbi:uncharacterized protein LOC62_05G007724 [Vanrija pseudolonga]|uniref:Uncharacterized protein n=1 Tax=Vanrija pseudolonga TaxID=143232 RepID=A0AAF0YIH3_9TREE|nr:hypothetical protein LOC62_05G007724 [Vanrija pseudolonga]